MTRAARLLSCFILLVLTAGCGPRAGLSTKIEPRGTPLPSKDTSKVEVYWTDANFPLLMAFAPRKFANVADITLTWTTKPPKSGEELRRALLLAGARAGADAVYMKRSIYLKTGFSTTWSYYAGAAVWK